MWKKSSIRDDRPGIESAVPLRRFIRSVTEKRSSRGFCTRMLQRNFVTGVTGFVGSHLAYRLLADGHHVLALARGGKNASARERVIEILGEVAGPSGNLNAHLNRLEILEGDIS